MKRDRGIDFERTQYRPGVFLDACDRCQEARRTGAGFRAAECACLNTELVFADLWERQNEPTAGRSGILTTLFRTRDLDVDDPDPQLLLFERSSALTRRERVVAATVSLSA